MTLWTPSVFSTTTMSSPCTPPMPSSRQAAEASSRRRSLKTGSVQAFATTLAPRWGPTSFSYISAILSTASSVTKPFSMKIASRALTRAAISSGGAGRVPGTGGGEPCSVVVI